MGFIFQRWIKPKLAQHQHLKEMCTSSRGSPIRSSTRPFFAANLRKPRMGETWLIGVSVSGEHCSRTWSHVVYAAEQTKIFGGALVYRANRMFKPWIPCSATAKIPSRKSRKLGKYLHKQVWNINYNTVIHHWSLVPLDEIGCIYEGPISLNRNSQRM